MASEHDSRRTSSGGGLLTIGLGIAGFVLGGGFGEDLWGALSGSAIGVLFAQLRGLKRRITQLERPSAGLEAEPLGMAEAPGAEPIDAAQGAIDRLGTEAPHPANAIADRAIESGPADAIAATPPPAGPGRGRERAGANALERASRALRSFFFGGNTLVRVGLLVLLVGLTLLAKYAADNALFPVEARLAFAALVGLGLVGIGYRQRALRPGFGLSLQGGGVAALYLVTFFAFRTYALIPAPLAFGLFVALAIAVGLLSVVQRAQALLVIGLLGGFAAPVLASTGEGNHVVLFGYYAMLIASVAAVGWRQDWRAPAVVAFVATYGVATTWGVLRYQPALLRTTEPFVLLFMLLFTGTALLHARRRPPELRGFVDGTLIFGTPIVSILLQGELVRERPFGLALSAAGFALFYLALAGGLWRRAGRAMRPLAEAFLALAIGFATMAIPFAFDEALTTSIAWALEGVGLYWVGARQQRALPRLAGASLQILAAIAFFASVAFSDIDSSGFLPIANGRLLSCVALAAAGIGTAALAFRRRGELRAFEVALAQGLGISGLIWWTGGSIAEIDQFVDDPFRLSAALVWAAATAVGLERFAARVSWLPGRLMSLASLPGLVILLAIALEHQPHLLADLGWLAWPLAFAALLVLWQRIGVERPDFGHPFRAGSLWLAALVAGLAASGAARHGLDLRGDWVVAGFGLAVAALLLVALARERRGLSPFASAPANGLLIGLGPVAGAALVAIAWLQGAARGDTQPLPYLPLANPADLIVALLAIASLVWWRRAAGYVLPALSPQQRQALIAGLAALAFAALNGVLARSVHQWTGVAYRLEPLWESVAMQVTLSIAWTLLGLVGMLLSSRRGWRPAWMSFAGLLGVVVLKLFTVDLSTLGTVPRIGTFLAVGALLLVLGYLSPVPPARAEEPDSAESMPATGAAS